jgi:stress response protein YsnF
VTDRKERSDRFTELEERFKGYEVYDPQGEKIGKVDDLFINENDEPEYIGVKIGLLGMKSTLVPMDACTVDEERRVIEVSESKDRVKEAPSFDDDEEITPEYENTVRSYFGLEGLQTSTDRGSYGPYYPSVRAEEDYATEERTDAGEYEREEQRERPGAATAGYREEESRSDVLEEKYSSGAGEAQTGTGTEDREREESQDYPGISIGDRERRKPQEHPMEAATTGLGTGTSETDGVRAQPTAGEPQAGEEIAAESRAGTETPEESRAGVGTTGAGAAGGSQTDAATDAGEYESGGVRVHKRVQPGVGEHESESMRVQKRVRTDREQIRVPKKREEVRVERVPAEEGGEELRVRKETVEDEEVVEVDVDKEEVEVDDETEPRTE